MNAISGISAEHAALLEEYRAALRAWTEIRALHPSNFLAPQVIEATRRLEAVERKIKNFRESELVS